MLYNTMEESQLKFFCYSLNNKFNITFEFFQINLEKPHLPVRHPENKLE